MKFLSVLAIILGVATMAALVLHFGAGAVIHSLLAVGGVGFAVVCLIHAGLMVLMGLAWSVLLPGTRLWVTIWGRFVRDSGSEVLPLSQFGGYVLGTRALALAGVPATQGAASTIVDVTLEFVGQLAYIALGLGWLVALGSGAIPPWVVLSGLIAASSLAIGFIVFQHRGIGALNRIAGILGRGWAERTAAGVTALHQAIGAIYRRRSGIWASFFLHFGAWVLGAVEIWIALRFAGAPLPLGSVMVIESLLYAIRSVTFVVPNAVGVQEGAYILLGTAFGLTPEMALALSLLKRARDLAIGLPVLAAWQAIEGGRLWRRTTAKSPATPATNPD
jgi:putative membrane protein